MSGPLPHVQQALWLLHQRDPGNAAYNERAGYRLRGPLNTEALRCALEEVVRRHGALRTVFPASDGVPRQSVQEPGRLDLPVEDLTGRPTAERESEAARFAVAFGERPFDLSAGPVFRAALVRLGPQDHVLWVVGHLIVFDGPSKAILRRELVALYTAFARGEPAKLPPLAVSYDDYDAWQRSWLTGELLERRLAYWSERLAGAPAETTLPLKGPRPPVWSYSGARVSLELGAEPLARLHTLGWQNDATLFMTLLAAFRALLSRYTGENDLCIGTLVDNRHKDVEGLIGTFINALVLRTSVPDNATFLELLADERATALAAYDHQGVPFELVVQALRAEGHVSRPPLFQVMLAHEGPEVAERVGDLEIEPVAVVNELVRVDAQLSVRELDRGLGVDFVYNTQLIQRETAEQMARHYVRLLEEIAADATRPVRQLPLLSEEERRTILEDWSVGKGVSTSDRCVHELFAEQVRRQPDAVAIVWGNDEVTYGELDRRAAGLARRLRRLGVGPESRVGLCMERTPDMIAAMFGILQAGGAYVPVEPSHPPDRLAFLFADARAKVVVAGPEFRVPLSACEVVRMNEIAGEVDDGGRPDPKATPQNIAVVIYTSGSTGQPKGALLEHRSVTNYVTHFGRLMPHDAFDGVMAAASVTFDVSIEEIFGTLCRGGRLFLARDALALAELPRRDEVILVDTVPSVMVQLVATQAMPASAKYVVLAGERLTDDLVQRIYAPGHVVAVMDTYGPTEATCAVTAVRRDANTGETVGPAIPGARIYVLDEFLQPLPAGIAGELYLGGVGMARGYGDQPGLTAARFVPDPFAAPGARMYRTGDLARWRNDGMLVFIGRADEQVKVRGYRIELGEIETVLDGHPGVSQCVVVTRDAGQGVKQLVAYVVASAEALQISDLREYLGKRLPDYMVPAAFVILDALPLITSGKVNRNALPAPSDDAYARDEFVAPRTQDEHVLTRIWQKVLGVTRVGVNDNFFALGGHSLLVMQILAMVRDELGEELEMRDFLDSPTVAGMAALLRRAPDASEGRGTVESSGLTEGPYGLIQPYFFELNEDNPSMGIPLFMPQLWRVRGALDPEVLERAVHAVAARHEILRTTYARDGETVRQVVRPASAPFLPAYECEDWSARPGGDERERALAASMDELAKRPADLARDTAVRVRVIRLAAEEHALMAAVHHMSYDGPSISIFDQDLATAYGVLVGDRSADPSKTLRPLPFQFLDVATYVRSYLDTPAGRADKDYWSRRFDDVEPVELPVDFPRDEVERLRAAKRAATGEPHIVYFPSGRVTLTGDRVLASLVANALRRDRVTHLAYLLTATAVLLHAETGQTDIALQTGVNSRPLLRAEQLIGGFNSPISIRVDLSARVTHGDLLLKVQESLSEGFKRGLAPARLLVPEHACRVNLGFLGAGGGAPALRLAEAVCEPAPVVADPIGSFDLRPFVVVDDESIWVEFSYNERLFRRETVERMCASYLDVLRTMAENPHAVVGRS